MHTEKVERNGILTTRTKRVLAVKRMYPARFRNLVLILDSWCARIAMVTSANGWYTSVSTLEGWYFFIVQHKLSLVTLNFRYNTQRRLD